MEQLSLHATITELELPGVPAPQQEKPPLHSYYREGHTQQRRSGTARNKQPIFKSN